MGKKMLVALVLIGFCALVLVVNTNRGEINVNLIVWQPAMLKSLAFLLFTATGVAIGVLLHK